MGWVVVGHPELGELDTEGVALARAWEVTPAGGCRPAVTQAWAGAVWSDSSPQTTVYTYSSICDMPLARDALDALGAVRITDRSRSRKDTMFHECMYAEYMMSDDNLPLLISDLLMKLNMRVRSENVDVDVTTIKIRISLLSSVVAAIARVETSV